MVKADICDVCAATGGKKSASTKRYPSDDNIRCAAASAMVAFARIRKRTTAYGHISSIAPPTLAVVSRQNSPAHGHHTRMRSRSSGGSLRPERCLHARACVAVPLRKISVRGNGIRIKRIRASAYPRTRLRSCQVGAAGIRRNHVDAVWSAGQVIAFNLVVLDCDGSSRKLAFVRFPTDADWPTLSDVG